MGCPRRKRAWATDATTRHARSTPSNGRDRGGNAGSVEPRVELVRFPEGYGTPTVTLAWSDVQGRLIAAKQYWLVTTRPSGAPHVVPTDGIWHDDNFYFGGHPATVHLRNLEHNQRVAVHLENATAAVIVEGNAERVTPSIADARSLARSSKAKYGWGSSVDTYRAGVWRVAPRRVLSWNELHRDATRFSF